MRATTQRLLPFSAFHGRAGCFVAALLLAALVAVRVAAAVFIAHAADHDCPGHDCPVCELILVCESNLRLLGSGYAPAPVAVVAAVLFLAVLPARAVRHRVHLTPVALKVRLNL